MKPQKPLITTRSKQGSGVVEGSKADVPQMVC